MDLGRVGLWTFALRSMDEAERKDAVAELDELGYGTIWYPGGPYESAFRHARVLLDASRRLTVASGIISIWAGEAPALAALNRDLDAAHPGRFLFGIGVSHPEAVNRQGSGRYTRPIASVREYLDALDAADPAAKTDQRALAALGPQMLRLAAERTRGAHPYFVPIEHTAFARETIGAGPLLAPEQAVVLETEPERARAVARAHMAMYLRLQNYANNLRRFGFTDDDINNGGSDRLVDAIVAWGDAATIAERVRQHHDAGADHVCLQVLSAHQGAPRAEWRSLAEVLFA